MKKILYLIAIALVFASCGNNKKTNENSSSVITVSILPEKTFVQKIAGDDFEINLLIPPGSSPAAYTLLPSQMKDIARSAIWFRMGYIGFEHSWKEKIEQANTSMKVVNISESLDLIAEKEQQHGDHVHLEGVDPHTWLSPRLVKQMAKVILDEVSAMKPERKQVYQANYEKFIEECDQLDAEIHEKLDPYKGKKIIVFHPSLSYYAREYGLVQYSLESGGKEPTPAHMKTVVDLANQDNLRVIYIQSEFDREHARVFANEIDGKIVQIWPLNPDWAENLRTMTNVFTENF